MHRITEVKALPNHRLFIRFENGTDGEVDLSGLIGKGVFETLSHPDTFSKVSIDEEAGTVTWPGGIDICPDTLYHDLTGEPLPGSESKITSG